MNGREYTKSMRGRTWPLLPLLFLGLFLGWKLVHGLGTYTITHATFQGSSTDIASAPQPIKLPHFAASKYPFHKVPRNVELEYIFRAEVTGYPFQRAYF